MLFSSITFLYYFLPAVLILYFLVPFRAKNLVLLVFSLLFYAWGEPIYVFLMLATIVSQWVFGLLIDRTRGTKWSRFWLVVSVATGLCALGFFKYSDFFIETLSALRGEPMKLLGLALPIGISFYTFQILSYTIDLYRGETLVQRSVLKLATYVTLFPQLIAGPIVRYSTVAAELDARTHSWQDFSEGAQRFTIGLAKKVLIANIMAELAQYYKDGVENSVLFAWIYAIAFSIQLYFDFSGYSDMAIGLGRMFGFHFLENFNYPFISASITEFWRRWHMSLGTWFRDYVYFPMGGNRVDVPRQMFNLLVVWFLTGFWHGAGWNFIAWGLYFAVLLVVEKFLLKGRIARPIGHIYTILAILICFILFDAQNLPQALTRIAALFGRGTESLYGAQSVYYLRSYLVPLCVGIIGATPLPKRLYERLAAHETGGRVLDVARPIAIAALLLVVTAYLIDGSFNPFIYFRF